MPAPKIFLNTADIALITGISLRSAQNMLKMFEMQGRTVRSGNTSRGRLVGINHFVNYLCEQDGEDPAQRKRDIMECLKANGAGHKTSDIKKGA